jgi:WD40 repeat protein
MTRTILVSCALGLSTLTQAQAVLEPATRTIQLAKAEVTCLVVSPKGDRILVGTDKGAELIDLESGKRVHHFDFQEDNSTVVYHAIFNDNGEYVMLAGFTGKREVFDVKTGQKEGDMARFRWLPNSLAMKVLGLKMGNSTFDRYYQQMEARHESVVAKADKDGSIVFTNAEGAAVQTLRFPENKDQSYRAPCLFHGTDFITGTDNGRVMFFSLR